MALPYRELLKQLPKVLRARDFHLYTEGGKRLIDLWLEGGKAVLGHKPPRVLGELKNAAERGLFTSLPHPMERRFIRALGELFPGRRFRLYPDETSLRRALEGAGFAGPDTSISDPAFPLKEKAKISLWRPFLEPQQDTAPEGITPILIPVLPWPLGPAVLVLEKEMEDTFPAGELIPPVLLAPAARAFYDLAAALKAKKPNSGQAENRRLKNNSPRYTKIEKVLKNSPWRRQGIYLSLEAGTGREEYAVLFRRFLEGGFLIPPSPAEPAILPMSMSAGEESKLAELLTSKV